MKTIFKTILKESKFILQRNVAILWIWVGLGFGCDFVTETNQKISGTVKLIAV